MATPRARKKATIIVSAFSARSNFGKLLRRIEDEQRSLVIEKRGTPKAVLLSIRDYVKLAAPEPDVLKAIGDESKRNRRQANLPPNRQDYQGHSRPEIEGLMLPLRLVIDTNVVISAALKPDGLQRTVLLLALSKPARLYLSDAILSEYREVLRRSELRIRKACPPAAPAVDRERRPPHHPCKTATSSS